MKPLLKTIICLSILLVLITNLSLYTTPSTARFYILHSKSTLVLTPAISDFGTLKPGETVNTTIDVTYGYSKFAQPKGFLLLSSTPTKINISIEDKPAWCDAELDKTQLSVKIPVTTFFSGGNVSFTVTLTVTLSQDALGYEDGTLKIKAEAEENGNIASSADTTSIKIKTSFVHRVEVDETSFCLLLRPGDSSNISVNITNTGNMDIIARLNASNNTIPNILSITLPGETEIKMGETETLEITVKAEKSKDFIDKEESIPFVLTYHAKGYDFLTGDPTSLSLDVRIRSEKKPSPAIDPLIIAIIVAIIVIIALVIFFQYQS
ncbi:MAG TPA: hypothetical protein EYP23_01740 [Thermoplasmata archaeon]|nr:hypothetical protein [Thermoplasmata archaeon]